MMRSALAALLLLAAGCGGASDGFRIDQVSVSPNDIPLGSSSNDPIRLSASVVNDRQDVEEVWADCDEGIVWFELLPSTYPRWKGTIPMVALQSFPAGEYYLDLHARDVAGDTVDLTNAVKLTVQE